MESLRGIVFSSRTTPTQKAGRLLVGSRANGSQDAAAIPSVPAQSVRIMASGHGKRSERSEEHTSELQSLMRISYAVFCLKKKKNTKNNDIHNQQHEKKAK